MPPDARNVHIKTGVMLDKRENYGSLIDIGEILYN